MSFIRNTLCAAALTLLALPAAAQTDVRVMAQGGAIPFAVAQAGGQVEITPAGGNLSFFAEYNRWLWGMICDLALDGDGQDVIGGGDRCAETGYTLHAGITHHLRGQDVRWRPYVSAAAGVARVLDEYADSNPARPSLGAEIGYDVGRGPFQLRLGARWQGRPQVGTDYVGPVIGFRFRL